MGGAGQLRCASIYIRPKFDFEESFPCEASEATEPGAHASFPMCSNTMAGPMDEVVVSNLSLGRALQRLVPKVASKLENYSEPGLH